MYIKNANVFLEKSFVKTEISFDKTVTSIGEHRTGSDEAVIDAGGGYVIPGLVDIHTHGALGCDFSDGRIETMPVLSNYYASNGVTSYLAATMTVKEEKLLSVMQMIKEYRHRSGAKCAGIHLEGPFLNDKKRGAHALDHLLRPDAEMFWRLNEESGGRVRMVTVAPEEDGALPFIRKVSKTCKVSIGHSNADYDTAMKAFEFGASHVTHLFNGMTPFLHRDPGIIGAAMDANAGAELICDGIHVHPSVIRASGRMFGDRLNLISDSIRCAGMPDGDYTLGGNRVVLKRGTARLTDGTLAGSSISLIEALRNAVRFGITLENAVYAASTAPAQAIGEKEIGSIAVGKAADLLILDKDLKIISVFIDGVRQ